MENGEPEGAEKGSKKQLQMWVNGRQDKLNRLIISSSPSLLAFGAETISWKSPLKDDKTNREYYEYRDDFLDAFGLADGQQRAVRRFWPAGGPQWDGLAVVDGEASEPGYLLVEAKAHAAETGSKIHAEAPKSIEQIKLALAETQGYMQVPRGDWTQTYYQLANRLAFLYLMNVRLGLPAWIVLVNFLGDKTYKPTDLEAWVTAEREMFTYLGLTSDSPLMNRIVLVHPPAIQI